MTAARDLNILDIQNTAAFSGREIPLFLNALELTMEKNIAVFNMVEKDDVLDHEKLNDILVRHNLTPKWIRFRNTFLDNWKQT